MKLLFCFLIAAALTMGGCAPDPKEISEARAFGGTCAVSGQDYKACRDMCWDRYNGATEIDACRTEAQNVFTCPSCGPSK